MVLRFFMLAVAFFFISCSDIARDNPYDPDGINYQGEQLPSSTSQSEAIYGTPVPYEGEIYQTVVIGSQTWFQRNLNYAVDGSVCGGGDCATYGRLYNWATAMTVCPSGWHLPTYPEWSKLFHYVDGTTGDGTDFYYSTTAVKYLKARSGWNSYQGESGNGTDAYGFSALPGGSASAGGTSTGGNYGLWWTASVPDNNPNNPNAYRQHMYYNKETPSVIYSDKGVLFSVRCLQD